jgi:hypothetical protein
MKWIHQILHFLEDAKPLSKCCGSKTFNSKMNSCLRNKIYGLLLLSYAFAFCWTLVHLLALYINDNNMIPKECGCMNSNDKGKYAST